MTQNAVNSGHSVIQFLSTSTASTFTLTTPTMSSGNVIPTNTDGTEILTLSITPTTTTSKLVIQFNCMFTTNATTSNECSAALFQDSTSNALAAVNIRAGGGGVVAGADQMILLYSMTSGTTSSTTFKIRCGTGAGTVYLNSNSSGRLMGGVSIAYLTITEYL